MSEHSRYEKIDQQFNDLPMPDQEASWQKMKEMLDDDDDTIVPPPIFLKSCLGWGILLTGLIAAWLIVRPEKLWSEAGTEQVSSSDKSQERRIEKIPGEQPITHQQQKANEESFPTNTIPSNQTSESLTPKLQQSKTLNPIIQPSSIQTKKEAPVNKDFSNYPKQIQKNNQVAAPTQVQKTAVRKENSIKKQSSEIISKENIPKAAVVSPIITQPPINITSDVVTEKNNLQKTDTLSAPPDQASINADSLQIKRDSVRQKKTKQNKLLIVAGLGEQFLIPIAGQTTVPYSRYGRKSSLADYVPSLFILLQKQNKWFVQTEFRYGAAQSVKEFSYNQKTNYDALSNNVITTTMRLKKTYYHQLPASFNYFIKPNLSIGVGGMYSHFYGAVTEKEITTLNTQTQTASTVKKIIPIKQFTDSFLYKTQVHALLQADYHWKKFSFGLRYTKDVQPYIRYTRPDGTVDEEKNQSLQVIVRYRFWQSQKF